MNRRDYVVFFIMIALTLIAIVIGAMGASLPGSAADPLLSLDWIQDTFIPDTVAKAEARMDSSREEPLPDPSFSRQGGTEIRLKRSDVLTLGTGSGLVCLAGSADGEAVSGALVDTTAGTAGEKTSVIPGHRYLAAEDTAASFTVTSDTAVLRVTGPYQFSASEETDYNAMADALKAMGLFRGSDVPFGSGYELESAPTRIQGLIMFLRLIGDEEAALAYSGSDYTFPDVPGWALPYVSYAYDRGYAKGYGVDDERRVLFGAADTLGAREYVTFLLRALGYAEGTDFNWQTAVPDAWRLGILTDGEVSLLTEKPFLRAQVVYLSFVVLDANVSGEGKNLADKLVAKGAIEGNVLSTSRSFLLSRRL